MCVVSLSLHRSPGVQIPPALDSKRVYVSVCTPWTTATAVSRLRTGPPTLPPACLFPLVTKVRFEPALVPYHTLPTPSPFEHSLFRSRTLPAASLVPYHTLPSPSLFPHYTVPTARLVPYHTLPSPSLFHMTPYPPHRLFRTTPYPSRPLFRTTRYPPRPSFRITPHPTRAAAPREGRRRIRNADLHRDRPPEPLSTTNPAAVLRGGWLGVDLVQEIAKAYLKPPAGEGGEAAGGEGGGKGAGQQAVDGGGRGQGGRGQGRRGRGGGDHGAAGRRAEGWDSASSRAGGESAKDGAAAAGTGSSGGGNGTGTDGGERSAGGAIQGQMERLRLVLQQQVRKELPTSNVREKTRTSTSYFLQSRSGRTRVLLSSPVLSPVDASTKSSKYLDFAYYVRGRLVVHRCAGADGFPCTCCCVENAVLGLEVVASRL